MKEFQTSCVRFDGACAVYHDVGYRHDGYISLLYMIMLFIIYAANLFKPKPPEEGVFNASSKAYYPGLYTRQQGADIFSSYPFPQTDLPEPPLMYEIIAKIPHINVTNN